MYQVQSHYKSMYLTLSIVLYIYLYLFIKINLQCGKHLYIVWLIGVESNTAANGLKVYSWVTIKYTNLSAYIGVDSS